MLKGLQMPSFKNVQVTLTVINEEVFFFLAWLLPASDRTLEWYLEVG